MVMVWWFGGCLVAVVAIGGEPLMVIHWWPTIGGQPLAVSHWWSATGGQPLVVSHRWPPPGGQVRKKMKKTKLKTNKIKILYFKN